ncbi:MAG: hypothetical protein VX733_12240 [Candidatus Latescibacterota bacterium]|nr:hypothetical protein [Candidatus Latescibacterota bacterium]
MTKFTDMKGIFGLLPTPYQEDLKKVANFCFERAARHRLARDGE